MDETMEETGSCEKPADGVTLTAVQASGDEVIGLLLQQVTKKCYTCYIISKFMIRLSCSNLTLWFPIMALVLVK